MNDFIFLEYDIKYSQEIIDLWNEEIGFIYPISPKMFNQNINNRYLFKEGSFVVFNKNKLVGFILTKIYDNNMIISKYINNSWISLFYVSSEFRCQGIGSALLKKFEEEVRKTDVTKISVGSDIDCFFPGIPNDFDNLTDVFFSKRGYNVSYYTHDLVNHLNKYKILHQHTDKYIYRYAKKSDKDKVLEFFKECFYGRWYYEALEYFDDNDIKEEYLIVLDKDKVIGFLRTNKNLISKISYNVMWSSRFEKLIGLGPLGVNSQYRKQGIASNLIKIALKEAKMNNYSEALIDWTGLVAFYQKYGFETWKCYQYANKNIK